MSRRHGCSGLALVLLAWALYLLLTAAPTSPW